MVAMDNNRSPADAPAVLVLSRPDDFASVVLASAALFPTKNALPDTKIYLLVREEFAGLFHKHPALEGVIALEETDDEFSLAKKFSEIHADTVVHLAFSPIVYVGAKRAGVQHSVAFERDVKGIGESDPSLAKIPTPTEDLHEAFFNFKILKHFGVTENEKPDLSVSLDPAAKISAHEKLGKYGITGSTYAVFCLDGDSHGNAVAPVVFSRAADCLRKLDGETTVLVIGEKNLKTDARYLRFCRSTHGADVLDLRGQTSPAEIAWILADARLCLTGENACAYLAAAENCPLAVALFSDFSDNRWFPLGHLTTNIFTSVHRRFFEPKSFYYRRAANAFSTEKISSALQFLLALKE